MFLSARLITTTMTNEQIMWPFNYTNIMYSLCELVKHLIGLQLLLRVSMTTKLIIWNDSKWLIRSMFIKECMIYL